MRFVILASLLIAVMPAQAALIDRGQGFIYDDVLDITWTKNASINDWDTWDNQLAWADSYSQTHSVYGTFDDWRLAEVDRNGDGVVVNCAYASEATCQDNEFGYLAHQYGISHSSPGVFRNVERFFYWSGTDDTSDLAWCFLFGNDPEPCGTNYKVIEGWAWAVRDGDIAANVIPLPAAVWLFGSALAGLGWVRRKQTV